MSLKGPTQGAERHTEAIDRWKSHRHLARLLRWVVLALPIATAIGLTYGAGRVLPPERLGIGRWVWIAGAFVACNLVLVVMGRVTRRLTPLIALMKLSLVFPDQAPARSKATLRKSNSRKLFRQIEEAQARGETTGPTLHGEYLVQVLRELNNHDRLTRGHSERVRAYAEMLGEELQLGKDDMDKLRWAALLHDVGKLEVPEHILNKDGRPDEDEWALLSAHPTHGGRMLEPLRPWLGDWVHAADQHHLRWDGNGYPLSLAGTDIAMPGRLVAIADAYDVMTSARSYKTPLSPEVARQELTSCAGAQFDPTMVRAFLNIGLGKLRAVAGPLAWFANAVGSTQVPVPIATTAVASVGSGAVAAAAIAVAAVTGGFATEPDFAEPEPAQRIVEPAGIAVVDINETTIEDQPITIEIGAEGEGTITFEVGGAAHGQVVMGRVLYAGANPERERSSTTVTYLPDADYHGEDSFGFEACDETGSCGTGSVTVTVASANDAPTARDDRAEGVAGTPISIDVTANDTDLDGDEIRLIEIYPTAAGTARIVDGQLEFVADSDATGTVRIQYVVTDPSGARSVGVATIELSPADESPQTTTTTAPPTTTTQPPLPPQDDVPVVNDDAATTPEDVGVWIEVLANDADPEGVPLSLTAVGSPLHGTAVANAGRILYTPADDYWGSDVFTYTASDGTNADVAATVTVTISAVNDAPLVSAPDATVAENASPGTPVLTVTAVEVDGDSLGYAIVAGDPDGKFDLDNTGALTLAGALDHESVPSYFLTMSVSDGSVVVPVTASVMVDDIDEDPTAGSDSIATNEDIPTLIRIAANDADPEGGALTFNVPATSVAGGTLTESGGAVSYTPPDDWSGSDSFTYTAADPAANTSNVATVNITVGPVNDAPEAVDDGGVGFTTPEDTLITTADVTANDSDVDHAVDPASVAIVTLPALGTLTNNGDGTFDYDPAPAWSGTETFTYTITDPGTLVSNIATVTLVISAVNDPPVAGDDSGLAFTALEDTLFTTGDVTTNDADTEDVTVDPATINVLTLPANGTLFVNGDGTFDYDPDPNFNGTDTFTYEVNDTGLLLSNIATVTLSITPVNDEPGFAAGADPSVLEDAGAQTVAGWASAISAGPADESGQSLTFTMVSNSNPGLFAIAPAIDEVSGDLTFTAAAATSGIADVEFTLSDDGGTAAGGDDTSPSVTVRFTVTPAVAVVLSEFRPSGPGGNTDEFIEVFNAGSTSVDLSGWKLRVTGILNIDFYSFPSVSISPGQHFLVAHTGSPLAGTADDTWSGLDYGTWGDVVLKDGSGTHIDIIGFDSGSNPILWEGTKLPSYPGGFSDRSYERLAGGASGNCTDTDDNLADWVFTAVATPRTMSDPAVPCQEPSGLVISEWSNVGAYAGKDFIELYNASAGSIDIEGWTLEIADDTAVVQTIPLTGTETVIPPGGHYLIAEVSSRDQTLTPLPDGPGIRVSDGATVVDTVGTRERTFGTAVPASLWSEGTGVSPLMDAAGQDQSWERKSSGPYGNCEDTDDNSADFVRNFQAIQVNPQHSWDSVTLCTIPVAPPAPNHLVISEFRTDGPNGGGDEFVEVFNPTAAPISLSGYELLNEADLTHYVFPAVTLQPGEHYLTGGTGYLGSTDDTHGSFTNGSAVKLYDTGTTSVIDDVDVGDTPPALPTLDGQLDHSYERRFSGCQDTDVWMDDFLHQLIPNPSTSTDPAAPCA